MEQAVLIWGAGAIGGIIGAHLIRAGRKVLFVDIADDHVQQMTADGVTIEGPLGGFSVRVEAITPDRLAGTFQTVLIAVKSQHTAVACRSLLPHLAADGFVVSCQNGINEPSIAGIVGRNRTIGAFVNFAGDYLAPGCLTYGLRGTVAVGELDGSLTPRIEALRSLLANFEPDAVVTNNMFGFLWAKMSYAAVLTASALTNQTIADFIGDLARRHLITHLVHEILSVAVAEGVQPLGFDAFQPTAFITRDTGAISATLDALAAFNCGTGKTHSGIWRDLAVRRRKTEVVAQLAPIQQIARQHRLTLPLANALLEMIGAMEDGRREQGDRLADELADHAAALYP